MISVPFVFGLGGGLIVVGFLANYFFHKIRIPDSVFLILLGILVGPLLHLLPQEPFLEFSGLMASIAIMIILFEAGLSLEINRVIQEAPLSFAYATMFFSLTSVLSGILTIVLLHWNPVQGFMLGILLGGSSAAVVIPIAKSLNLDKNKLALVSLESTITNVYNVILVLAIASAVLAHEVSLSRTLNQILGSFAIAGLLGAIIGIIWAKLLSRIPKDTFTYTLTLGILLLLYSLTEYSGSNGAVASLVFGLVLGNARRFKLGSVSPELTIIHREISFFIRVFFFFLLGLVFQVSGDPRIWLLALGIGVFTYISRYISATLLKIEPRQVYASFIPKGLSEAVVAALLIQMGLPGAMDILQVTTVTILVTNLLMALLLMLRRE